ncbi:YjjG family noncanonical pyrimidine nucleotidase [Bacillus carboniphilus]|uniref:YjjG family noncanonical pyrimidine nucleotidase n=1 Tax=Bacillus carboniphilus TaxID=86663 RepID=A0ABY9JX14_9BACI|nr:YjjG family noncanonical pyrimidine nucleotidase [Bacillus carboniphilus]WLR42155.1 YjjG family noncanonical pyrimidine nucleotidase [Bacillus carboniphilus]
MKKYQTLLFDIDHTLLDFHASEKAALQLLFQSQNFLLTNEIETEYQKINRKLWQSFERGETSRDEVVNTRFSILFDQFNQKVDGAYFEQIYCSYLEQGNHLINGALDTVSRLHNNYDLYIVTNGVSKTQFKRLHSSGLHEFFKAVFVSEDTGYQKPMKEFFDYVFKRIPHFSSKQTLIIGDSLSSDMKGGNLVGIDTCWFNPQKQTNHTDIIPTYEIQSLEDIHFILNE